MHVLENNFCVVLGWNYNKCISFVRIDNCQIIFFFTEINVTLFSSLLENTFYYKNYYFFVIKLFKIEDFIFHFKSSIFKKNIVN